MKPKILAVLPGLIPSTLINIVTPLLDLHRAGKINTQITLETKVRERDVEWSDLVILCRNVDPRLSRWFLDLSKHSKPYIYDIDDNFFEMPLDTPLGRYYRAESRLAMFGAYISHANLVRVYSLPMLERAKGLQANVLKVAGPVDWRLLAPAGKRNGSNKVKIVYATSRVNDTLAELFKPALKRILEKYPDRIQVHFLGYNPPEFKKYPNVFFKALKLNYRQYLWEFSKAGFDIGLAPLLNDEFHRSKTNLKVREYGACRIAGIYSDVDVYSTSIVSGKTGLLIQNDPDAWFNAMSDLIENKELRETIQTNAFQFAHANFSHISFNQIWYEQIMQTLHQSFKQGENLYVLKDLILSKEGIFSSSEGFQNLSVSGNSQGSVARIRMWLGSPWIRSAFQGKVNTLIFGLRSEGVGFIIRTLKMKLETFWLMLKIRAALFFS